jgi:hypothetical protein
VNPRNSQASKIINRLEIAKVKTINGLN